MTDPQLRKQFEEYTGIMANLTDELETALSPYQWQQLARDAHDTALEARELMEELEAMDDTMAKQVMSAIQQSMDSNCQQHRTNGNPSGNHPIPYPVDRWPLNHLAYH